MVNELNNGIKTFYAQTRNEWRKWLEENHQSEKSVWLIIYKTTSKVPSVYYPEAVDEALCFGWIDSKPNKRDQDSYYQFFSKRNPKSNWSRVNKIKTATLISQNLMTSSGLEMINIAKQNGNWDALEEVENLTIPDDLQKAFDKNKVAFEYWKKFSRSSKRGILEWIFNAKKIETRQKRIDETVRLASANIKANY
ncbi:YdeI/OmpD-associated family protein [Nodularia chucula]|uniref:YdeI/OmpD-associated family protein n=1 Tax=Nodularia chucula TaxID=3093667 RepID=UPI0039C706CD